MNCVLVFHFDKLVALSPVVIVFSELFALD